MTAVRKLTLRDCCEQLLALVATHPDAKTWNSITTPDCVVAVAAFVSDTQPGEESGLPDDLFSHEDAWRSAIEEMRDNAPSKTEDGNDDRSYWEHELNVFDRTWGRLRHHHTPAARPLEEWHEDMGDMLWWKFPIDEAPYVGSPICLGQTVEITMKAYGVEETMRVNVGGWPGYHTHFTPIPLATAPQPQGNG